MVYAPGRDAAPSSAENDLAVLDNTDLANYALNPARGAGGVFANFLQGMTAKYADNTRGYRGDFYRNTLARLFVRVDTSEMNLFKASIPDEHTENQLVPRLVGDPTRRQRNRTSGGAGAADSTVHADQTPAHNGYLDFFIQQASMPLQEKVDLKETLADNYVAYFFGQSPPVWTFSGWLFNSVQDDQTTNFLRLYLEILRGTQLARRQKVVSLKIDSYIITGAIISTNFTLQSTTELYVPFQFQLLVKRVAIVNYTVGWLPTRAETPFAADPNAIPYDGRRMRSGDRAAIAAVLSPNTASESAPVPDRTADTRTTQPPAPTDPLTEQATAQNRQAGAHGQTTNATPTGTRFVEGTPNTNGAIAGTQARAPVATSATRPGVSRARGTPTTAATRATQAQVSRMVAYGPPDAPRPETVVMASPAPTSSATSVSYATFSR